MKKNNKPNPLKLFNDNKVKAYKQAGGQMDQYKKALRKAQDGIETRPSNMSNPLSLNAALGNFNLGYDTNVSNTGLSNNRFTAGYNNPKSGLAINAGYDTAGKNFSGGIDYNTTIGKNNTPLRLGVTYNRKNGGALKSKKK